MNGKKAKELRKRAISIVGGESTLTIKHKTMRLIKNPGKPEENLGSYNVYTFAYSPGSFRRVYQDLKREYKVA